MISRKHFRILVSISLFWMFITIIASYFVPTDLSPILQSQVDLQLDRMWSNLDSITAVAVLALLISHISLLFFKPWARIGYLVLAPALFVITLLSGPAIDTSFDSFSNEVDIFISGILWATLMFTNIKNEFSSISNA